MKQKRNHIIISYWANPNAPNRWCHKDKEISNLIMKRGRKFLKSKYKDAWEFQAECLKPITTLKNILWAFPREEAIVLLELIKEQEKEFLLEETKNLQHQIDVEEANIFNYKEIIDAQFAISLENDEL